MRSACVSAEEPYQRGRSRGSGPRRGRHAAERSPLLAPPRGAGILRGDGGGNHGRDLVGGGTTLPRNRRPRPWFFLFNFYYGRKGGVTTSSHVPRTPGPVVGRLRWSAPTLSQSRQPGRRRLDYPHSYLLFPSFKRKIHLGHRDSLVYIHIFRNHHASYPIKKKSKLSSVKS
jgi:hypothetical protein